MSKASIDALRSAIRGLHGCDSKWVGSKPVSLMHASETVWDGSVQLFDLIGHPSASRCYAWEEPPEAEGGKPKTFAVLEVPPVRSAADAVRASIVARSRGNA